MGLSAETNSAPQLKPRPIPHVQAPAANDQKLPRLAPQRDLVHEAPVANADLAAYTKSRQDAKQLAEAARMQRNSWVATERIFRPVNDQAGDSLVRDTVITIFPPGR